MVWAWLNLAGFVLFTALSIGLRSYVQYRRTGSFGFRVAQARGVERIVGLIAGASVLLWIGVPLAALCGWLGPIAELDKSPVHLLGVGLAVVGIAGTLWAQFAMGDSWRIGLDNKERTALVTHGPFGWVRNPIYSAVFLVAGGGWLLIPNLPALVAFAGVVAALEIQVRLVEEPFLISVHGDAYRAWASRVGRFVPGFGRL
jgi:protein-S-isoprenylcysteine O-methyltransferase Ste14